MLGGDSIRGNTLWPADVQITEQRTHLILPISTYLFHISGSRLHMTVEIVLLFISVFLESTLYGTRS
jgi:hypothetical protein